MQDFRTAAYRVLVLLKSRLDSHIVRIPRAHCDKAMFLFYLLVSTPTVFVRFIRSLVEYGSQTLRIGLIEYRDLPQREPRKATKLPPVISEISHLQRIKD